MPDTNVNLWQNLKAGDVISLWDIMTDLWIQGDQFYMVAQSLDMLAMKKGFEDSSFFKNLMSDDATPEMMKMTDSQTLKDVLIFTEYFGLKTSTDVIKQNINLAKDGATLNKHVIHALIQMVRSELSQRGFLMINSDKKEYWEEGIPNKGESGIDKFPAAIEDLAEGHRCFAVSRYTATVFHLMRAMEIVVRGLADKIDANIISEKTGETLCWGVLVGNIKAPIDKMPKGKKKDDWCKAHALLHSVNRSFRTETAHPKKTYTEEEAKAVVDSVRAFISELSELEA